MENEKIREELPKKKRNPIRPASDQNVKGRKPTKLKGKKSGGIPGGKVRTIDRTDLCIPEKTRGGRERRG